MFEFLSGWAFPLRRCTCRVILVVLIKDALAELSEVLVCRQPLVDVGLHEKCKGLARDQFRIWSGRAAPIEAMSAAVKKKLNL